MALTAATVFDLVGGTQTITLSDPAQVDQITFSDNSITFASESSYNLVKSDLLLYITYLNTFNTLLLRNFPIVNTYYNKAWPLSLFEISITDVGVTHITYNQTSMGTTVLNIDYVPQATAAGFTARVSPITVTLQEYLMTINMLNQYYFQISAN